MSLLAYTGPIYRQTNKETFLLEDECKILIDCELQVDWVASKAGNVRFICILSQCLSLYLFLRFLLSRKNFFFKIFFAVSYELLIWLTRGLGTSQFRIPVAYLAGVWKERRKLGGGELHKGARKGFPRTPSSFPRAWFSTMFFESPPHKLGVLTIWQKISGIPDGR